MIDLFRICGCCLVLFTFLRKKRNYTDTRNFVERRIEVI